MSNSGEGVSKEVYLEMVEMLGEEPDPSKMPVEYDDFPPEVQGVISTYSLLQDRWEPMSGTYLGKDLGNLESILRISGVESSDYLLVLKIIRLLDQVRGEIYEAKAKQRESLKKPT